MNGNKVTCFDNSDPDDPIRLGIFNFYDISEGMIVEIDGQDWKVSDLIYMISEKKSYAYLDLV